MKKKVNNLNKIANDGKEYLRSQVYDQHEKIRKLGKGATGTSYLVKIKRPPPDFRPEEFAVIKYIDASSFEKKDVLKIM